MTSLFFRVFLCVLLLLPADALGSPHCKKGIPCGGSCISATKTCHVGGDPFVPTPPRLPPPRSQSVDPEPPPPPDSPFVESSPSVSPFDDSPASEPAPPPDAPAPVVGSGLTDPCGHVPSDEDHAAELEACRTASLQPAPPPRVLPSRPLDDEVAPRTSSRHRRAGDYERGVELESRGQGLLIGGIVSAVGGIVLILSGALLQKADDDRFVDGAVSGPLTEPTVTSTGPRTRGTIMAAFGGVLLGPLAHGLVIPGAFMLVRGRNLQRRAEFGLGSAKFRF